MTSRPFHHGNLRAALLDEAEMMLRETGTDGLSLRELARRAGVSHGAPRSHFIDRQALLDALAERGFEKLTQRVRAGMIAGEPLKARFRRVGHAYVDFAVHDAALMELMFAAKMSEPVEPLQRAAARLFEAFDDLLDIPPENSASESDLMRFKLMFGAAMQGTATLIAARRVSASQGEALVDDATDMLLASELGALVLAAH